MGFFPSSPSSLPSLFLIGLAHPSPPPSRGGVSPPVNDDPTWEGDDPCEFLVKFFFSALCKKIRIPSFLYYSLSLFSFPTLISAGHLSPRFPNPFSKINLKENPYTIRNC